MDNIISPDMPPSVEIFHFPKQLQLKKASSVDCEKQGEEGDRGRCSSSYYQPLHLYFTCQYYTCLCPFRPTFDKESGCWTLSKTGVQQNLVALFWMGLVAHFITSVHVLDLYGYNLSARSSKSYFQGIRLGLYYWVHALHFWALFSPKGQERMSLLLNKVSRYNNGNSPPGVKERLVQGITLGAVLYSFVFTVVTQILMPSVLASKEDFQRVLRVAWKSFFSPEQAAKSQAGEPYEAGNVAVMVAFLLFKSIHYWGYNSVALLLSVPVPLAVWSAVGNFRRFVEEATTEENISTEEAAARVKDAILTEFYRLKSLTDEVNGTYGLLLTVWAAETGFQVIFTLQFLVDFGSPVFIVDFVGRLVMIGICLVVFADHYRKMCCFKSWLGSRPVRQQLWNDNNLEWVTEVKEVELASVGIGMNGVYEISYSFLAQALAVALTLFIVSFE